MKARNILLVDDNEVDTYITRQMLLKQDAAENIIAHPSAMDALEYLNGLLDTLHDLPQYIFLDIRMPEMDGFGFLEEYTRFPETLKSRCSIFMLTSSGDERDIERAAQYPYVKKFLKKPLDMSVIKDLLLIG